jgi:hypothetical protein
MTPMFEKGEIAYLRVRVEGSGIAFGATDAKSVVLVNRVGRPFSVAVYQVPTEMLVKVEQAKREVRR